MAAWSRQRRASPWLWAHHRCSSKWYSAGLLTEAGQDPIQWVQQNGQTTVPDQIGRRTSRTKDQNALPCRSQQWGIIKKNNNTHTNTQIPSELYSGKKLNICQVSMRLFQHPIFLGPEFLLLSIPVKSASHSHSSLHNSWLLKYLRKCKIWFTSK